ncbi:MAG TPA: hypothetical protein DDW21_09055, partial [Verrucomicrobiales bacterium]|nr:hypothetical protein [Verrucomicrobiales bacterium]
QLNSSISAPYLLRCYLHSTPVKGSVGYTDCHLDSQAYVSAQASDCLACSSYISLRNYEITDYWHRRTQTRSDVHIQKKAQCKA